MITQYTRLIVETATDKIVHCTSQDFPFSDGWEPVGMQTGHHAVDFELDSDYPDADFGIGVNQAMVRGRQIIDNFEIVNAKPQLSAGADSSVSAKILRVSDVKPINETAIKIEIRDSIRKSVDENALLVDMKAIDSTTPETLEGLSTVKLIRIQKAATIA